MGEERKLVTILFADIVGSTRLTGEYDAEVVRASLDRAFATIEPLLTQHGATVEKFIGDAVLAVKRDVLWAGLPVRQPPDYEPGVCGIRSRSRHSGELPSTKTR